MTTNRDERLFAKGQVLGLFDSFGNQIGLAKDWRLYILSVGSSPVAAKSSTGGAVAGVRTGKEREFSVRAEVIHGWKATASTITVNREIHLGEEVTFKFLQMASWYECRGVCNTVLGGGQSVSPVCFHGDGSPKFRAPEAIKSEDQDS